MEIAALLTWITRLVKNRRSIDSMRCYSLLKATDSADHAPKLKNLWSASVLDLISQKSTGRRGMPLIVEKPHEAASYQALSEFGGFDSRSHVLEQDRNPLFELFHAD